MKDLFIEETLSTPAVHFKADGKLSLEGRSIPERIETFYNDLEEWISKLNAPIVVFNIKMEYFNSASSKKIYDLLKQLEKNESVRKITINWFYEEGDDDCLESGEIFMDLLDRSEVYFYEYEEAEKPIFSADCVA